MKNASWAFHSVIMALATEAARRVHNKCGSEPPIFIEIEPDIECRLRERLTGDAGNIIVILPQSTKMATLGRIIKDITNPENLNQAAGEEFIFFEFVKERPEEIVTRTMIGNLLLQATDLKSNCLGVAIADARNQDLLMIHNMSIYNSHEESERRMSKFYSCFGRLRDW